MTNWRRRSSRSSVIGRGSTNERGDTLIEVLVTLIILSVSGLALLAAFSATITGSAQHRSLAANDVVLRTVAESAFSQIQQQQSPEYQPCATASSYSSTNNYGAPSDYTVTIISLQYPASGGGWSPPSTPPPANCAATYPPQLLTVQVRAVNGTTDETSFVVDGRQATVTRLGALSVVSITPPSLGQGAKLDNLVVGGTGFVDGAVASFSGVGIVVNSTTVTSSATLMVSVSVPVSVPVGQYAVTITNPDGTAVTSASIFAVSPAPTVTGVTPASLSQGLSNQTVTIGGTGFVTGVLAAFSNGGVSVSSTVVSESATQLVVTVSVSPTAPTGSGAITVTNPDGSRGTSGSIFTVTPGVTISSPTSSSPCTVGFNQPGTCVISGTGFDTGTTVAISANATSIEPVTVTPTSITFDVVGDGTTSGGAGNLTVTNSNGASATVVGGFLNG